MMAGLMAGPAQRNWKAAPITAKLQWLGKEDDVMFLSLIAAAAIVAPQLETYRVGGGQAWINPPGIRPCMRERFTCAAIAFRQGDPETAVAELQTAVNEGDVRAMRALGLMLRSGIGVPADPQLGEYWLRRAAEKR
jgi:TPR repeat protein